MMFTRVLDDNFVCFFKFYFEGSIHQGMSYQGNLYALMQTFSVQRGASAFALACQLSSQGNQAVITAPFQHFRKASAPSYRVWVDLRLIPKSTLTSLKEMGTGLSDFSPSNSEEEKLSCLLNFVRKGARSLNFVSHIGRGNMKAVSRQT